MRRHVPESAERPEPDRTAGRLTRDDEIDRGLLLRSAGLVAGLVVKPADGDAPRLLRVLAITARGKRVLQDASRMPVEDIP